jgi:pyridoxine/pyridoxamine 5'-phosphate oxidase
LRQDERRLRQTVWLGPRNRLAHAISLVNEEKGKRATVTHDTEYFRRRAAEARAAACSKEESEQVEVAGELALAYAALARRRAKAAEAAEERPAIPLEQPA